MTKTTTRRSDRARLAGALAAWLVLACGDAGAAPPEGGAPLAAGGRHTYATLSHTCAVHAGALQCWGASDRGQTGDGWAARRRPLPVRVPGLTDVSAVAAGGSHTCALSAGRVFCFGDNDDGQAGAERPLVWLAPAPVPGLPEPATAVAAGLEHTCAIAAGSVLCWGRNEQGEAGAPPPRADCRAPHRVLPCRAPPTPVEGIEGEPEALALGDRHACALAGGRVFCWGDGRAGALGDGSRESRHRAAPVDGPTGEVVSIAAGSRHACAVADAAVWCWGAGRATPERVEGLPAGVLRVAAGGSRSCAATGSEVFCWEDAAPRAVAGLRGPVRALAVSPDHGCALQEDGVFCWGDDDAGQLGRGVQVRRDARAAPIAAWDDGGWRDANGDGRITLVCLGDSNTAAAGGAEAPWCDRLTPQLGADRALHVLNRGWGGATAGPSLVPAADAVTHAVESDAPDLAVLAYGTNDVLSGASPDAVVAALAGHVRALLAAGAEVWVATLPPVRADDAYAPAVEATNAALRRGFPEAMRIDFDTGLGDADLVDRVHLSADAQAELARRVARALSRSPTGPEPRP